MPENKSLVFDKNGKQLTEEEMQERIEVLRKLIQDDKHLQVRTDVNWLTRFLYPTKFEPEDAYKRMIDYYKLKAENPKFYFTESPNKMSHFLNTELKILLPDRDLNGRRVFITKMGEVPNNMSLTDLINMDDIWMEAVLDEPETQKNGLSSIIDLSKTPWAISKWLTPGNMRVGSKKADLVPFTDLQIHIVNTSPFLNAAIALIFPFLSTHTKEHIHFHYTDWPSLHKFVNPDILPKEYGGTQEIDHDAIREKYLYNNASTIVKNLSANYKLDL
ncbi:alpha-tocopherol transfer protein-like [Chrysoperla carnea]|uniref:alpha-tocopherol transfer protein-like n=1 Tax=Chrysoperla carnea TaxID=189513 RepID=UPI001D093734|nr:alpha-tocopherol transfer protein-like [Chrysoperla carnea]